MPTLLQAIYPLKGQRMGKTTKVGLTQLKETYWQLGLDNPAVARMLSDKMAEQEASLLDLAEQLFGHRKTLPFALQEIEDSGLLESCLSRVMKYHEFSQETFLPFIKRLPSDEAKLQVMFNLFRYGRTQTLQQAMPLLTFIRDASKREDAVSKMLVSSDYKQEIREYILEMAKDKALRNKLDTAIERIETARLTQYDAEAIHSIKREYWRQGEVGDLLEKYVEYTTSDEYVIQGALTILDQLSDPDLKDQILRSALQIDDCRKDAAHYLRYFSKDEDL